MNIAIGILLTIVGSGMIGFWGQHALAGNLPQGIRTLESGGYIAFHITAELLTGVLCMVGGLAAALDLGWGFPVALFASGMLVYTGINSLAWKEVRNKPSISIMFIVSTIIAIISCIYLTVSILD